MKPDNIIKHTIHHNAEMFDCSVTFGFSADNKEGIMVFQGISNHQQAMALCQQIPHVRAMIINTGYGNLPPPIQGPDDDPDDDGVGDGEFFEPV